MPPRVVNRPIALVGMRCSGKSRVGLELARRVARPLIDLDDEVVRWARLSGTATASVGELLGAHGPLRFRAFEAEALRLVLEPAPNIVLATGGGVVERADNRVWLARTAYCVWIDVPTTRLRERMAADAASRPPLTEGDPLSEIPIVLARRGPLYRALADLVVSGDAEPDAVAAQIATALEEAE